jgi:hypothetical protein
MSTIRYSWDTDDHCTVSKRYEIAHDYHDGCVGFRLVFSIDARGGV